MQIPKDKILEMLNQQGKSDQAEQAEQELPDQVDTDLLQKVDLNPSELVSRLGDDIPGL